MTKTNETERRFVDSQFEVRSENGKTKIEGYASVFNRYSQNLGGFVEQVKPGAFRKTIKEADVRALRDHDPMYLLGRSTNGTLEMTEDETGLHYRVTLPDTSYARDLAVLMERGDLTQSSFAFVKIDDDWGLTEQDFPLRSLLEVKLVDVSPVTYPAYLDTTSGISRSAALDGLAKRSGVAVTDLSDPEAIAAAVRGETTLPVDEPVAPTHDKALWERRAKALAQLEETLKASSL